MSMKVIGNQWSQQTTLSASKAPRKLVENPATRYHTTFMITPIFRNNGCFFIFVKITSL